MRTVTIIFKSLYACQHKCGFCHVLYVPRNTSYMSTDEVKATFDRIEAQYAGCRIDLDMSGGEFALRNDAVELIEYLRTREIEFSSLVLDTMAVPLADEALAERLGELFSKANVSVHAAGPDVHESVSASRTKFKDLEAGITHLFRYFDSIFTNTSINRDNWSSLSDIAKRILKCRCRSGKETPLFCAYYLPVYRHYGEPSSENTRRLQGVDNAEFLPRGEDLEAVRAEFDCARQLLAMHGVTAKLRDFNYPACVYEQVSGTYPEHAYGLPNFMNDAFFADYQHPIAEEYTLEEVYPSMYDRAKDSACADCIVEPRCPGITRQWREQGYEVRPVDEARYEADFGDRLMNRTLHGVFCEPLRMSELVDRSGVDWDTLVPTFYARLAGDDRVAVARERISAMSVSERGRALSAHLRSTGRAPELAVASEIDTEIQRLELLADEGNTRRVHPEARRSAPKTPARRLEVIG